MNALQSEKSCNVSQEQLQIYADLKTNDLSDTYPCVG